MSKSALRRWLVVVLVTALMPVGCGRKTHCNPDGTPSAESFAAHGGKPSEEEAKQFALKLEKAVAAGNLAGANALVDWDTLLDFATDTTEGSSQFRDGFIKGAKQKIQTPASFMGQVSSLPAQGGAYKFIRCRDQDGQLHVLFRLLTAEGAVNYHDLVVLKYPDGVRAADIYTAGCGELLSQSMRHLYLSVLAADKPSFLSKENSHDVDLAKHMNKLQEMGDAVLREHNPSRAIAIYDALPNTIKGEKVFLLLRMKAVQSSEDDAEYRKVLVDFQKYHPDDPCLDLISIDHYFLTKQFKKELAAIDHIDSVVGGDPYLNILRANTYFAQGKIDQALRFARKASEAEKDMKFAYETELGIAVSAKKFSDIARLLSILERDFHDRVDTWLKNPSYAAFKASKEYAVWKKSRTSK